MTGSLHQFHRQHSSTSSNTTTTTTMEKTVRPKFRRCSSADDHNSMELIADDKEFFGYKREHLTSDIDSGTEDNEQNAFIPSNDNDETSSTKSSVQNFDEGFSEDGNQQESPVSLIKQDLELAKIVPDETKKDFCHDTSVAFHGEFARLISIPLSFSHDKRYFLFAQEDLDEDFFNTILFDSIKLDNAKAQFKCPNIHCQHAWTSMRARISFSITNPDTGFIVLKIYGQNCIRCGENSNALWYIDEVCRVMKNLAETIFKQYFPDMFNIVDLVYHKPTEDSKKVSRHPNHDPTQRKGKMYAPHVKEFCEACRHGICFN